MKKILIADDDFFIRELYETICREAGFDVMTAKDGEEGYEKIKSNSFHLIILDIMMPRLDGLGLLSRIKEELSHLEIPVVVLTNLAHESVIEEAIARGAVACLIKSDLTPDKLVRAIQAFSK